LLQAKEGRKQRLRVLPIPGIARHVAVFLAFAREQPQLRFQITRIGCGLAGYRDEQIGPLFAGAPDNCDLPPKWKQYRYL